MHLSSFQRRSDQLCYNYLMTLLSKFGIRDRATPATWATKCFFDSTKIEQKPEVQNKVCKDLAIFSMHYTLQALHENQKHFSCESNTVSDTSSVILPDILRMRNCISNHCSKQMTSENCLWLVDVEQRLQTTQGEDFARNFRLGVELLICC